jgi:FkbM family methyltransferase
MEIEQHYVLASALSDQSIVLDLGANVGGFAHQAIACFECRVLALEPEQSNFEAIPDHPKLHKLQGAVGGTCGRFAVRISSDPTGHRLNAVSEVDAGVATEQVVAMHDFPSLIALTSTRRIDLMKIDVEGCEWDWLDTISDQELLAIGQLTIEFHDFVPEYRESNRTWLNYQRLIGLGFHCIEDPAFCSYNVLFVNRRLRLKRLADRVLIPFLSRMLRATWKLQRLQRRLFQSA